MSLCFQTETEALRAGEGLHSGPPADHQQSQNLLSASPATAGPQHGSPTFPRPPFSSLGQGGMGGNSLLQEQDSGGCPKGGSDGQDMGRACRRQQLATAARPRPGPAPTGLGQAWHLHLACPSPPPKLQLLPSSSLEGSTGGDRPQPVPIRTAWRQYRCAQLQAWGKDRIV